MVAISLYRGNMHRVPPDVPRRWLMPTPRISLKDFRTLLHRRSKALSLLPSSSSKPCPNSSSIQPQPSLKNEVDDFAETPNPNPSPEPAKSSDDNVVVKVEDVVVADCQVKQVVVTSALDQVTSALDQVTSALDQVTSALLADDDKEKENEKEKVEEKVAVDADNRALEGDNKLDVINEKERRKREVEEKLQILNEKKHNLVQALKQILNAEEELKRRSNMQAGRPPLPLQVDASNDSGSMTGHATPRAGSEAKATPDMEGGEGDDALNHNPHSRQLLRMSSTSPSAESALRKPPYFQHNVVSHPSRAAIVAAGSPSRFAPSGNQGHPSNLLTVSVSGTNYNASSPSPAASGGTSGFRDARQPSPWN